MDSSDVVAGDMLYQHILEDGVVRFDCSVHDRDAAFPSLSFKNSKDRDTPIVSHVAPSYIPSFECHLGQQTVKLQFPAGTSFYGTGEVSGQLERTGKRVFAWNTDAYMYGRETTPLYQSHPWVLVVLPLGEALGILADTTERCEIDIQKDCKVQFIAPSPYPVIVFGPFDSPMTVLKSLSHAVGTIFMPPKWSLGYHQCRWSYYSDKRVLEIAKTFREKGIPCDVVWMDIDYMDGFRCFTFDKEQFPDPQSLVKNLHEVGFKAIWMLDPGIKSEDCYFVYESGSESDGLSGQPLSGPDIGGFSGNATPKLFGRWMGVCAMFPFCRGHSEVDSIDHEPWSFGVECEEVSRLALKRRYRLLPHIYTLFHESHVLGTPVATPTFFADPKDPELRTIDNSFLLGPILVHSSNIVEQVNDELNTVLPKGIWLKFDFDDSHPDLPTLYLKGGSIVPLGPPYQHVGEAKQSDDLTLLLALDENGHATGKLYEDNGDGYEFTNGEYLLTHYAAELHSSVVSVKVLKTEGSWARPNRRLHVQLLLGGGAKLDAWGTDGEVVQITMPTEQEVSKLVTTSEECLRKRLETAKPIPELEKVSASREVDLSRAPVELKSSDWVVKVVPWVGGRIISMEHLPSGVQWLDSKIDMYGYEEYSGVQNRSAGCYEEYRVIDDLENAGEENSILLEADLGGAVGFQRQISIRKDDPKVLQIDSSVLACRVGAGSGGFTRLVCLRVYPTFMVLHPAETFISFTSIAGMKHEIHPEDGDQIYKGNLVPNGKWMLINKHLGLALVNRFSTKEVYKCSIQWGIGTVNMEISTEERPVSKQSPLRICHEYEVTAIS